MKATFTAEVVKDVDGAYLLRLLTGFGEPEVWVEKSRLGLVEMATIESSDPT